MINIEQSSFIKSKKIILDYLATGVSASTEELINYVSSQATECRDKVPQALRSLNREGKIVKKISKEKKAFIWIMKN